MSAVKCNIVKHKIHTSISDSHDITFLDTPQCFNFDFYINEVNNAVISY